MHLLTCIAAGVVHPSQLQAFCDGLKARKDRNVGDDEGDNVKPGAHCFTMIHGKNMPPQHREQVSGFCGEDVYCCVKSFIRDTSLQQEPLLVVKSGWTLPSRAPSIVHERVALTDRQVKDAHTLHWVCKKVISPCLDKAAKALEDRLKQRKYQVPKLTWMQEPLMTEMIHHPDSRSPYFPHLSSSTWIMHTKTVRAKL